MDKKKNNKTKRNKTSYRSAMETRMQGEGLKKKAKKQNTHNRPYIREVALWKGKRERKKSH